MTMLFEPFSPLFELSREMDRLLSRGATVRSYIPAADVVVTDDDVKVYMDVPGVTADDLEIELEDDVLTIKGERAYPYEAGDNGRAWQRLERGFGRFERVLRVPKGLDPAAIGATISDGVLALRIPKPEAQKPHRIQIRAATGAPELGESAVEGAESREPVGAGA